MIESNHNPNLALNLRAPSVSLLNSSRGVAFWGKVSQRLFLRVLIKHREKTPTLEQTLDGF